MFALLALFVLSAFSLEFVPATSTKSHEIFRQYVTFFNKSYEPKEMLQRMKIFNSNRRVIAKLNAARSSESSARFGLNIFADMSPQEFRQNFLGLGPKPDNAPNRTNLPLGANPTTAIDWVARGMTTPVKNQQQCGSCWAFSATETVESANLMKGNKVPLSSPGSPQEIVDCASSAGSGCEGGWPNLAIQWVQQQGGIESNACYPYHAVNQNCAQSQCKPVYTIKNSFAVTGGEQQIYNSLRANGPLSIVADAQPWQYYTGGVLTASQCGTSVDHAIQLTGYNPSQGGYWIVRNSWSAQWGINGFIWLQYGQNTCDMTYMTTGATA